MAERSLKRYIKIDATSDFGWLGGLSLNEYIGRKNTLDSASDAGFDVFRKPGLLQAGAQASNVNSFITDEIRVLAIAPDENGKQYLYGFAGSVAHKKIYRIDTTDHTLVSVMASWSSVVGEQSMELHDDHLYIPYSASLPANLGRLAKFGPLSNAPQLSLGFNTSLTGGIYQQRIPLFVYSWRGNLYVFHGNKIDYTDGTTGVLTVGARIPGHLIIKCATGSGNKLAVGASTDISFPGTEKNSQGSRVYFYDGVSNEWQKEVIFPEKDIFSLLHSSEGLLGWGKRFVYRYNHDKGVFEALESLDETERIYPGQPQEKNGFVWFGGNGHVKSYGRHMIGMPTGLHKPIASVNLVAAIKWINDDRVYVSDTSGNLSYVNRSGSSAETAVTALTRSIDIGAKFRITWVRVVTETLASGDGLELSARSEDVSSKVIGTFTFANEGAVNEKEFYARDFTNDIGFVNDAQIGVKLTGGNPKVRRIDLLLETVKEV